MFLPILEADSRLVVSNKFWRYEVFTLVLVKISSRLVCYVMSCRLVNS